MDIGLLRIIRDLRYKDHDIKVQAMYPLGRIDIHYENEMGGSDNIKVETGYMRRIPLMKVDRIYDMKNPRSGANFSIRSPEKEELFANKFCTMISRKDRGTNGRDIFDVNTVLNTGFHFDSFLDIVMIEGLLMDLDLTDDRILIERITIDTLRGLIREEIDLDAMIDSANEFIIKVRKKLIEKEWGQFRERFMDSGEIDHSFFNDHRYLNNKLNDHPQLKWIRRKHAKS